MARYIIEFSKVQTVAVEIESDSHLSAEDVADRLLLSDFVDEVDERMGEWYDPDWYTTVIERDMGDYTPDMRLTAEELDELIGE